VSPEAAAQGWYKDPYGQHEARWFSAGIPTSLVRDGSVEAKDQVPDRPFDGTPEPLESTGALGADDMLRADGTGTQPDYAGRAADTIVQDFPIF
jgi:hypothetical protein